MRPADSNPIPSDERTWPSVPGREASIHSTSILIIVGSSFEKRCLMVTNSLLRSMMRGCPWSVYSTRWIPVSGIVVNVAVVQNGGNVLVHQAVEQYKNTHPCNPFQAWIQWESNGRRELITRSSIIGVATRTGRQQRTRVLTQFFHEEFGYYNQYNNI